MSVKINKDFTDLIKELLEKNGWRHVDLAEKSGVSRTTISRILNGKLTEVRASHYKAISNLVHEPESIKVEVVKSEFERALLDQYRQLDTENQALALSAVIQIKFKMQGRTAD